MNCISNRFKSSSRSTAFRRGFWLGLSFLCLLSLAVPGRAQEEKPKVPGLDKIIAENEHLMFTGKIKSIDLDHNTMSVGSVEGRTRKSFRLSAARMF